MAALLVVEDEERIRKLYGRIFSAEGFEVFEAADARTGYEMLIENRPEIILLDINMAEVDGSVFFDVAQTFGKTAKVIVTSVFSVERQMQCIKGAADYYDKSDSIRILIQKVNDLTRMERRST